MARKPRYIGYQDAMKTIRNAPGVTRKESEHESIHQRLLRLEAREETMEKQEVGSHK